VAARRVVHRRQVGAAAGVAEAVAAARAHSNSRITVVGHAVTAGNSAYNVALSQRRAEAVVSYLTSQYNVQPSRLEAVGIGQERPLVETAPQTPEARNRRVQVINLGG